MQKENIVRFSVTTDLDQAKTDKRIQAYATAFANVVKQQKNKGQNN